jgi:hypothetical protein
MMAAEECVSVHVWFREETDIGDALNMDSRRRLSYPIETVGRTSSSVHSFYSLFLENLALSSP